jgi:hypothetical protein
MVVTTQSYAKTTKSLPFASKTLPQSNRLKSAKSRNSKIRIYRQILAVFRTLFCAAKPFSGTQECADHERNSQVNSPKRKYGC